MSLNLLPVIREKKTGNIQEDFGAILQRTGFSNGNGSGVLLKRIAVASVDGVYIDTHFGRADMFYIYDTACNPVFIERRRFLREPGQGHNASGLEKAYQLLRDCDAVFVSKIGAAASNYLIRKGMRVFEISAQIDEILQAVVRENNSDSQTENEE